MSGFKTLLVAVLAPLALAGCGINTIPTKDEQAKAAWGDVQNQYQRRSDLIPNLVATVQGYAQQEKSVLVQVTQARAQATHVSVDASTVTDPAKFAQYQQAQNQLSGVLGHLLSITENYPDLKSNQNFLALQSQLEGTEEPDRHRPARLQRGGAAIQYRDPHLSGRDLGRNHSTRSAKEMQSFAATSEAQTAPKVSFAHPTTVRIRTVFRAVGSVSAPFRAWVVVLAFAGLILGVRPAGAAAPTFPPLTGRVVDAAHVLSPQVQADLTAKLKALEQKNGDQLVVVTLPSLPRAGDRGLRVSARPGLGHWPEGQEQRRRIHRRAQRAQGPHRGRL